MSFEHPHLERKRSISLKLAALTLFLSSAGCQETLAEMKAGVRSTVDGILHTYDVVARAQAESLGHPLPIHTVLQRSLPPTNLEAGQNPHLITASTIAKLETDRHYIHPDEPILRQALQERYGEAGGDGVYYGRNFIPGANLTFDQLTGSHVRLNSRADSTKFGDTNPASEWGSATHLTSVQIQAEHIESTTQERGAEEIIEANGINASDALANAFFTLGRPAATLQRAQYIPRPERVGALPLSMSAQEYGMLTDPQLSQVTYEHSLYRHSRIIVIDSMMTSTQSDGTTHLNMHYHDTQQE